MLIIYKGRKRQATEEKKLQYMRFVVVMKYIFVKFTSSQILSIFIFPYFFLVGFSYICSSHFFHYPLCFSQVDYLYDALFSVFVVSCSSPVVKVSYHYFIIPIFSTIAVQLQGYHTFAWPGELQYSPRSVSHTSFSIYSYLSTLFDQQFTHLLCALWYELAMEC